MKLISISMHLLCKRVDIDQTHVMCLRRRCNKVMDNGHGTTLVILCGGYKDNMRILMFSKSTKGYAAGQMYASSY